MEAEKNYTLTEGKFASTDGRSQVAYYVFSPKTGTPRALLQICHGMSEYAMRYEPLANYLTGLGYLVFAHDHVGHGKSVSQEQELGFTSGAEVFVDDVVVLSQKLRTEYPDAKHVLLGHSMGSFLARLTIARYPRMTDACVIVGTGGPGSPTALGKLVARAVALFKGWRHHSFLIATMALGSYPKRFAESSDFCWLSRDAKVVSDYEADPLCGFAFSARGYYDLFDLLGAVSSKKWAKSVPAHMPLLLISGEADPVGSFGKGVSAVHRRLTAAGVADATLRLYPDMRHEIFNELGREEVFQDLSRWLAQHDL